LDVHDDDRAPGTSIGDDQLAENGPAVTDAEAIVERIGEDERNARVERDRLQTGAPFDAPAAGPGAPPLLPGEAFVDVRAAARIERMGTDGEQLSGRLYLTTERLVLSGRRGMDVDLRTIDEVSLIGEKLLVALDGGKGLCVDVASPRLFRVHIAHAISRLRTVAAPPRPLPGPAA